MKARRRKMTVLDLGNTANGYPHYDKYARMGTGENRGWGYYLTRPLSEEEEQTIRDTYTNVTILTAAPTYAPELKTQVIHLADKAIYKDTH